MTPRFTAENIAAEAGTTSSGVPVRLEQVSKVFRDAQRALAVPAVSAITLDIPAGQFVALLGPSGCGKSTLLRMIAGLETPTEGAIDVGPGARPAFVFQDAHLLPWRNVRRNVALPLEVQGVERARRIPAADAAIDAVGLADAAGRYPAQLSGGMRMRASLARALVTAPNLLLLDEPFAALDEITRAGLDVQLRELWRRRGMTVLFVTHSITEAAFLADRAIVFTRRPARIALDTPIDLGDERRNALRGEPAFAAVTARLLAALESGAAFPPAGETAR